MKEISKLSDQEPVSLDASPDDKSLIPPLPPSPVELTDPDFDGSIILNYLKKSPLYAPTLDRLYRLYMEDSYRSLDGERTPLLTVDQFFSLVIFCDNDTISRKIIACARYPESYFIDDDMALIFRMTIEIIDAIGILSQDPRFQVPIVSIDEDLNQPDGSVAKATTETKQRLIHFANWDKQHTQEALKDIANGELPNASF